MLAKANLNDSLTPALIAIIVPVVLGWMIRSARKETQATAGSHSVSYPKAMRIFVYAGWAVIVAVVVLAAFTAKKSDLPSVLGILALFTALVLPLHLETFGVKIEWDDENIYTRSPWRKPRTIPFAAIRSCDYSGTMQWYRIHTDGYGIIRMSQYLRGTPDLLRALPCHTPHHPIQLK
jgi:hypothetical protein